MDPTSETLRRLHLAHLLHVPFENLSIHLGEAIVLNDGALFEKIVTRRRGGFCYELNGLFAWLLREIGFDVAMLSACVARDDGSFTPDFAHMTLSVKAHERLWLADVGFGDSFIQPLAPEGGPQQQRESIYRIAAADNDTFLLERATPGGDWKSQYRFSLTPYQYGDYADMCRFQESSPESHFTQQRICSRLTPEGRISLSDMRFIRTENGVRECLPIPTREAYASLLSQEFGIVM